MGFDYAAKIRNLLDAAEATDRTAERETDPEAAEGYRKSAANYRALAEKFMRDYRIAEEEALAAGDGSEPIEATVVLTTRPGTDMSYWYRVVFATVAAHTGVRHHIANVRREHHDATGRVDRVTYDLVATVVGYEGDIRYTEYLWTAAYLMFSTRVDPVWDDSRTEAENIYLLRNAGIERKRIANQAWGNGDVAAARSRVQRIYLRECELRNETPMAAGLSHDTKTYRTAYAQSFRDTLARRLQVARDAADSVGGAMVLHGRADRVDEAFYARFPMYRPSDTPPVPAEPCKRCQPGKPCRTHRWTATDEARWQRANHSPSARAGRAACRAQAADYDQAMAAAGIDTRSRRVKNAEANEMAMARRVAKHVMPAEGPGVPYADHVPGGRQCPVCKEVFKTGRQYAVHFETRAQAEELTGPARLGEVVDENGVPDRSFDETERQRLSDIHASRKSTKALRASANAARGVERDRTRAAGRVARRPRPVLAAGECVQAELHSSPGICACGHRNGM